MMKNKGNSGLEIKLSNYQQKGDLMNINLVLNILSRKVVWMINRGFKANIPRLKFWIVNSQAIRYRAHLSVCL